MNRHPTRSPSGSGRVTAAAPKVAPAADPKKLLPAGDRPLPHKEKKPKPRRIEKGKRKKD